MDVTEEADRVATPASDDGPRFEALVAEVHQPLLHYLLRRADRETAADVLGDTLLVLWRRRADVPEGAALPWAYGVARGCLANARRGDRRREALVSRLVVLDPPRPVAGPDATGSADPGLAAAMSRLTTAEREVLALWAWEGLSPSEIAVALDVTPNAVSIRLHRAKARLRDLLQDERDAATAKDEDDTRTGTGRGREE